MRQMHWSWEQLQATPTYVRRYSWDLLQARATAEREANERARNEAKGGHHG
jgi:hypothetical protein